MIIDDLSTGGFNNIKHLTDNPRFNFPIETVLNKTVMDRLVSECGIIFHLAAAVGVELAVRDPVRTIETNVLGTDVVLKITNFARKPRPLWAGRMSLIDIVKRFYWLQHRKFMERESILLLGKMMIDCWGQIHVVDGVTPVQRAWMSYLL